MEPDAPSPRPAGFWRTWAAMLGGVGVFAAWRFAWALLALDLSGLHPSLQSFADSRGELQAWVATEPTTAWLLFLGLYTLDCALCLSGTVALVVVGGTLFGFWRGLAACALGGGVGAGVAFLFSRRFLSGWVRRHFPMAVEAMDRGLALAGDTWLVSVRLFPMMSFSLVNLVMGLSRMPLRRFVGLSVLGLLPGLAAYAWAGTHLRRVEAPEDLLEPRVWIALSVMALLPFALRWAARKLNLIKPV